MMVLEFGFRILSGFLSVIRFPGIQRPLVTNLSLVFYGLWFLLQMWGFGLQ